MGSKVTIETWGDFALWTRPEGKVERLTYPVPTPGAVRGLLSAIYSKPAEFYWRICTVEVLRPLKYITFKRNEVKAKYGQKQIFIEEERTQRQSVVLQDVRYRVTAEPVPRPEFTGKQDQLVRQFLRRVEHGKCFFQPSMGTREFPAYFGPESGATPVPLNLDIGYMVYDVFDLDKWKVEKKAAPFISLFHARLDGGVLSVPEWNSPEVLKPGTEASGC